MDITQYIQTLNPQARADLEAMDPAKKRALARILLEHPDFKGRSRREVTNPPLRGSRRYPWG